MQYKVYKTIILFLLCNNPIIAQVFGGDFFITYTKEKYKMSAYGIDNDKFQNNKTILLTSKEIRSFKYDKINFIALGDFNIDERGDLLNQTFVSEGLFIPPALQNDTVTRSIFDQTKYYDQIAWFNNAQNIPNLSLKFLSGGNYNFVGKALANRNLPNQSLSFMMSDHCPLWAEFEL